VRPPPAPIQLLAARSCGRLLAAFDSAVDGRAGDAEQVAELGGAGSTTDSSRCHRVDRQRGGKDPDIELVVGCNTLSGVADETFDPDLLDEFDPFEIDAQSAHLFKHPHLGIEDINDVWASDPLSIRPSRQRTG
jgi:hypothetical protein